VPDVVVDPAAGSGVVEVVGREFDDARTVAATVRLTAKREYSSQAAGVVRKVRCAAGKRLRSGSVVVTVDDRPVVALRMASPPWRSLSMGARGSDVEDLQRELRRLGAAVEVDGYFSWALAQRVRDFWTGLGVKNLFELPLDRVVWLRSKSVVPGTCDVKVGDRIGAGAVLFTTGGRLESLRVQLPETAQSGARAALWDEDVAAPILQDGVVDSPVFLAEFAKGREYVAWLADRENAKLTVATRLAEPVRVVPVPPSSLYGVDGGEGCLVDDGAPRRVRIIASELGETFVSAEPLPSKVRVPAPEGAGPCG
jgi:hypothetical protein